MDPLPTHYQRGSGSACGVPAPPVPAARLTADQARVDCRKSRGTRWFRADGKPGRPGPRLT